MTDEIIELQYHGRKPTQHEYFSQREGLEFEEGIKIRVEQYFKPESKRTTLPTLVSFSIKRLGGLDHPSWKAEFSIDTRGKLWGPKAEADLDNRLEREGMVSIKGKYSHEEKKEFLEFP